MKVIHPARSPGSAGTIRPPRQPMSLAVVDLVSTTAGRRIRNHRMNSHRAVFVYRTPPVVLAEETLDDPDVPRSAVAVRLNRLRIHPRFSPVGSTALRPVADAANTISILREVLRGPSR